MTSGCPRRRQRTLHLGGDREGYRLSFHSRESYDQSLHTQRFRECQDSRPAVVLVPGATSFHPNLEGHPR